jgi:hypothetical protein
LDRVRDVFEIFIISRIYLRPGYVESGTNLVVYSCDLQIRLAFPLYLYLGISLMT